MAAAYYDIGTAGEMHHNPAKNVLFVAATVASLAVRLGRTEPEVRAALERARTKLRAARDARPTPFVDRTRYTNWNAMMASAMLRAGTVLGDEEPRRHALLTLARLRDERVADDAVAHTPGGVTGLLDDQVQVAAAALDALRGDGRARVAHLGGTAHGPGVGGLLGRGGVAGSSIPRADGRAGRASCRPRAKPVQDAPTPSPNGVAGIVCARLHELTGEARWRERGLAVARAFAGALERARALRRGLSAGRRLAARADHASGHRRRARRSRGRPDARRRARAIRPAPSGPAPLAGRAGVPAAAAGHGGHGGGRPRAAGLCLHRDELSRAGSDSGAVAGGAGGATRESGLAVATWARAFIDVSSRRGERPPDPDPVRCPAPCHRGPARPRARRRRPGRREDLLPDRAHRAAHRLRRAVDRHASAPSPSPTRPPTRSRPGSSARSAPPPRTITRGTLHSLCFSLLRDYAAAAGPARGVSASPTRITSGVCSAGSGCGRSARSQLLQLFGRHRLQHVPLTAGDQELFEAYSAALTLAEPGRLRRPDRPHRRAAARARRRPAMTSGAAGTTCWWTSSRT